MTKVILYTRRGCHLCDRAKQIIDAAHRHATFQFEEYDIDSDPNLLQLYNEEVPVIAINGVVTFKYVLTEDELLHELSSRS